MLVPSGSNKNHFPAEVSISSVPLQNAPLLHSGSATEDSQLWNVVSGITENGVVTAPLQGILSGGIVVATSNASLDENCQPAATDNVNNNKRNRSDNFRQNYITTFPASNTASPPAGCETSASDLVTEEEEELNRDKDEEDVEGGDADDDEDDLGGRDDNEREKVILSEVDLVASVNISLNNSKKNCTENISTEGIINNPPPSVVTDDVGAVVANMNRNRTIEDSICETGSGIAERKLMSVREEGIIADDKRLRGSPKMKNKSQRIMSTSTRSNSDEPGEKMDTSYGMNSMKNNVNNNHVNLRQGPLSAPNTPEMIRKHQILLRRDLPLLSHSMIVPRTSVSRRDKYEFNQPLMRFNETNNRPLSYHGRSTEAINASPSMFTSSTVNKRHVGSATNRSRKETIMFNRRSMPSPYLENRYRDKFDVSTLDTNLPRIDLEAIENHLRIAREEERKRRSDREEIRRRLALESDDVSDKPNGRKPSLHTRLQSSMNLQICFMNETASDSESPNSDTEAKNQQPASLPHVKLQSTNSQDGGSSTLGAPAEDFFAKQARLQAEARQALSQAKEMARLQMTQEKDRRLTSPITEMVKNSLLKVGVTLPPERRRVSRQLLTEMNVAQLQVIVNDLHTHIEVLNETLVSMLLERDDLHMEQDSMLVDIEDLTRYLAAKDNSPHQSLPLIAPSRSLLGKK